MPKKIDIEAVKKQLKCGKKMMILLAVYKVYGMDFNDQDEAIEFVKKMMEWEQKEDK